MKSSEILTRAAELVDSGQIRYACWAISFVMYGNSLSLSKKETVYLMLRDYFFIQSYHVRESDNWFGTADVSANKQHRVLALLLCAAIAADMED